MSDDFRDLIRDIEAEANPIGTSVADHLKESLKDPEFRAEYERLARNGHLSAPGAALRDDCGKQPKKSR